jgi:hypothetical protein
MTPADTAFPTHPYGSTTGGGPGRGTTGASPADRTAALVACRTLSAALTKAAALEAARRPAGDDTVHVPVVKFVDAQVRMRFAPALADGWPGNDPVHIVLFGGTNSGKSTVLNLLLGRPIAGMNAIPRFSQHPEGFNRDVSADWFDRFPTRWEGYARYVNQHPPRQTDAELRAGYKPAVSLVNPDLSVVGGVTLPEALAPVAAPDAVLWDCPDFSTVQARAYMGTVIDAAAMADVIVVTVTTESYLDDRGGQLLTLLVDSGAVVHVVANKVSGDPQLLADIRAGVGTNSRGNKLEPAGVHPLPMVTADSAQQRLAMLLQSPQGNEVRRAVRAEADRGTLLKRRALLASLDFVERRLTEVLLPLDREADVGRHWQAAVDRHSQSVILDRYASDYINSARYGEFNRTLGRLMELVEVPIISDIMKGITRVLRTPYTWVKRRLGLEESPKKRPPEEEVLTELVDKWISTLRGEAQQRQEKSPHPGWAGIIGQLDSAAFRDRIFTEGFAAGYADYRHRLEQEERQRAEAMYKKLAERPVLLNSLRTMLAGADALALFLAIKTLGGIDWSDLVVGPVMLKVRRWFTEKGLGAFLEAQKAALEQWQRSAVSTLVYDTLAAPARGLFKSDVSAQDVEAARGAFRTIKATLMA